MQERQSEISDSVVAKSTKSESKSVSQSSQFDSESKSDLSTYMLHASVNKQPSTTLYVALIQTVTRTFNEIFLTF